jgi:formylglycine-generating enzyme required for sulfatase activity
MVSWSDAQNYVSWLSNKTGKAYRLLSESEREYVTRAGTMTRAGAATGNNWSWSFPHHLHLTTFAESPQR